MKINLKLPARLQSMPLKLRWGKWRHNARVSRWHRLSGGKKLSTATLAIASCGVIVFGLFNDIFQAVDTSNGYQLPGEAEQILIEPENYYSGFLKQRQDQPSFAYNEHYAPTAGPDMQSAQPKFRAEFSLNPNEGVQITDPVNETTIKLTPKFSLGQPQSNSNRLIYPLNGRDGAKVITLGGSGIKEDIVLYKDQGNDAKFEYELELPDGVEVRLEDDGSLGFYGVSEALLGDVATGSEADAQLLQDARQNGAKTTLLFRSPAPFILEARHKVSETASAWYSLDGNQLTINATGLSDAKYPLSVDPSIYVETAAKLMRGNNETNVDFDVNNELIQKSQTTGARIDAWEDNLDMNQGTFDHGTAAAGGYVYRVGGRTGPTKPLIVGQQTTTTSNGSDVTNFTMDMPSTRPAGDLYIALICHDDGGDSVTPPSGGGWIEYADTGEHAAYYKIGTDQGGGNESASYQWSITGGSSEEWGGVIMRVTGFNSSDVVSGTPGTTSGSGTPQFPATTPDNDATLVIRAVGADNDAPSDTGWVPTGHTKIASDTSSTTTGDCGFVSASLDTSPASGVSTGTVSLADSSIVDTYGASTIAINPAAVTPTTEDSVYWAQFNSSTLAIEGPNPGAGVCTDWCTNTAYDLPEGRRGFAMAAYNGYLYVIGGVDGSGNRESTVLISKLGVNGEPSLWHPTDTNKNNWVYWYSDAGLSSSTARSYLSAVPYNNRMYILGGQTNASSGGTTTMEYADIRPNGTLGSWTSGTALPAARHSHTAHIYNDVLYLIGGNNGGTLQSSVHYNKLNSDGSMNSWVATTSFTTARSSLGGVFTAVWGAYIYLGGGCTAVNGSGYCTTIASDMQLGSINADGTISEWGSISGLSNQRVGYNFIAWQNGLYRLGGCAQQNTSTGECIITLADVDFGVVNPAGEVSTVSISVASGVSPCSGGSPHSCDLPPPGDDAGEGGQLLSMSVILNGYLYNIGGCIDYDCDGTTPAGDDTDVSGNISYVSISSSGQLSAPGSCGGTSYGAWCVDSTNKINNTGSGTTDGIAAGGVAIFNNRIYVVGGLTGNALSTNIYWNSVNADGSLAGAWSSADMTAAGIAEDVAYTYAYARANPSSAGTYPGNLFVFGGCGDNTGGAGCGSSDYETEVYKCNITTTGAIETADANDCDTSGQLQIDSEPGVGGSQGLGIHSGTVYANYIFLVGGFSQSEGDKDDVMYARIDNNNNVVAVSGGAWIVSPNKLSVGRRRGWAFGYNGHIYAVGGYDDSGTGIIPFIEWSKMNVSDGSIDPFITSSVTINQRWGLTMTVSNSYAYVIGGCDVGASPGSCSSFENSIQTFQLYNNDSGAANDFTAQSDDTFAANEDRWGASAAILNGYLYVAGGCISATDCTDATNNVQYAPISATNGTIGTWASASNVLPADRTWGSLEVVGGFLYYLGGQNDTATNEQSTVYYVGTFSSGNITAAWSTASGGIGDTASQAAQARTKFGSTVWNNRIYVVGGLNGSAAVTDTIYISPQLNSGGNIAADSWTEDADDINVARTGAAVTSYANNLYLFGGFDGTNYLSDVQYTQINTDGTIDAWSFTTSLPGPLRDASAFAANGYIYLVNGRSAASTCAPNTLITPISANTTIATGNNPTGVGEWYETNVRYTSDRYGAAVAYDDGKFYTMGGGCTAPIDCSTGAVCNFYSTVKSQPQVAIYSRLIDTDTDVFPNSWLMNGIDNSIGARWQVRYRSMNDTDGVATDCGTADMTTWGQETNYGDVTLGDVALYTPLDGSGNNTNCARYFYFFISIDASKTFGYPEDVNRGPTIADITLFFTADPSKRLRHGKTFTGGLKQPLDTPCRQSVDAQCPLP